MLIDGLCKFKHFEMREPLYLSVWIIFSLDFMSLLLYTPALVFMLLRCFAELLRPTKWVSTGQL